MRFVVTSFGSAGDFLPTLALAAELHRRGHQVRFVANPFYEGRVRNAGLEHVPAGEYYDLYQRLEQNPAYGKPVNAGLLFRDLVAPNSVATHAVVGELLRSEAIDAVIGNDASFGAIWAAAQRRVPSIVVHATPMIWMSWQAPVMFGDRPLPMALARPATAAARRIMNWYLTRLLRPLARQIGTSLNNVSFAATEQMPVLRLGLWSARLRGPVASDPPNGRICGFTRSSAFGGAQRGLPEEVERFLDAGPAPVVVALGSAYALISGALQTSIAEACADTDQRCLIIGHPSNATFPSNTLAVRYAPYDQVFARAAAVVVHGGAGTTGEALRCGKPIIGVPFAFDQFDLCAAVERLGVGIRLPLARRSRIDFARVLTTTVSDASLRQRAEIVGSELANERDGAESGADCVESLCASAPQP